MPQVASPKLGKNHPGLNPLKGVEVRLQPTTGLVETTDLGEQKPLTVFYTTTVIACT